MDETITVTLTKFEREVLKGVTCGYSFVTIARKFDSTPDKVENAFFSICKKLQFSSLD